MDTITVQVSIPQSLLYDSGLSQQEVGPALLRAWIMSLYHHDRISSGKAASLLGVRRMTFIHMLAEDGVPYLDSTPEELNADLAAISAWPQP
jgi:predicted HTH domain antitoxin